MKNDLYGVSIRLIKEAADTDDADSMVMNINLYRWMLRKKVFPELASEKLLVLIEQYRSVDAAKAVVDVTKGDDDRDPSLFDGIY